MPAVYEHPRVVRDDEIDEQHHANNVAFVAWMQDAALAHSAAQGWPPEAYRERNLAWVVRRHEIDYRQPAHAGDQIVVRTWVASMDKVTSVRRYEIVRISDDQVLASAATTWVMLDTVRLSPCRIPPVVATSFELVAESDFPSRA